jgi:UDP-2,3-diacylglucosamine pyrophosphatase LpxH
VTHYRSIFISDTHLGSSSSQAKILLDFLRNNTSERLYLVGDIVDGWKVVQNKWRWKRSHSDVIQHILKLSSKAITEVYYVTGNHDEFLRPMVSHQFSLGSLTLYNHVEHVGVDGKRYLVVHGDMFDGITSVAKWIALLGDTAYDLMLWVNNHYNSVRHRLGLGYWSLSKWLKHRVKKAVNYIFEFEGNLAGYCKRKGYDAVICGHIHHPEIREIDGVTYANCGDWVESCSALVENHDGTLEIIYWKTESLGDRDGRLDTPG